MAPKQKPWKSKQNYQTPPEFIQAVKALVEIEDFSIDLAADAGNTVAKAFYSEEDDAFDHQWKFDGWGWLNPPFSHIEPWVKMACQSAECFGTKVALLLPASVGSNWWKKWVHRKATILLLNGRLQFVGTSGPYPKDCALLLFGTKSPTYLVWEWKKGVVS